MSVWGSNKVHLGEDCDNNLSEVGLLGHGEKQKFSIRSLILQMSLLIPKSEIFLYLTIFAGL